ncbi:MAG TPA: lipase family protein [Phototrophicaceae bacterium]|nr:lipase family protein [Phototrophicaceae bacterium]
MIKKLLLLFFLIVPNVQAQDTSRGDILNSEFVTTHTIEQIDAANAEFYPVEQRLPALFAADEYRVTLRSTDETEQSLEIVAQVFVPRPAALTEFPVLVVGAGTSGLADPCAPSLEQPEVQDLGHYRDFLLSIASQGYVVLMPDYAGFNDPDRLQAYYVAEMAARALLDTGRAAYRLFAPGADWLPADTTAAPLPKLFFGGYSQGGQAVFAVRDRWATAAPDVPVAGFITWAPVTNMASHTLHMPPFAPYRMVAWADYYGEEQVPLKRIFVDRWLPTLKSDAARFCVMEALTYYSAEPEALFRPPFLDALRGGTLDQSFPELARLLDLNSPGFVPDSLPALVIQGTKDARIPMATLDDFVSRVCAVGNPLTVQVYEGATHAATRRVSYRDTLAWMQAVVEGERARNDCP